MSESQRRSLPGVTEGEEPGEGISSPATVVPGTVPPTSAGSETPQEGDPGGYPHEPAQETEAVERRS